VLHEFAERAGRRALIVLISDLFDDAEQVLTGIRHLRHRDHDVIVFHILDPDELEFPFDRMTRFEGLEAWPEVLADPRAVREAYLNEVRAFNLVVSKGCAAERVDYRRIATNVRLDIGLSTYLAGRMRRRSRRS